MTQPQVLAIDLGTSSVKAALLSADGTSLATSAATYPMLRGGAGAAEQDPDAWWAATCEVVAAIRTVVTGRGFAPTAIAVTGQMHGVVLRDAGGRVLRPCLTWADERGRSQLGWMAERVSPETVLRTTANPLAAGMSAAKLVWLRSAEPATWQRIRSVLFPKDELRYRLTGHAATDPSDASGSQLFDAEQGTWAASMAEAWGIDPGLLPPIEPSASDVGPLRPEAAADLGIRSPVAVYVGAGDTPAAALGLGVVEPAGVGLLGLGTAGQLLVPTDRAVVDGAGRINAVRHATPAGWCAMAATLDGGGALAWLGSVISRDGESVDDLLTEAEGVPPGAGGIIFVAHLSGERTPGMDAHARASFHGLAVDHRRGHLVRAVLEGVAYALREGLDALDSLRIAPTGLRMAGGGGRSDLWRRIMADVLGLPVTVVDEGDASARGAALLVPGMSSASPTAGSELRLEPDGARRSRYDDAYGEYLRIRAVSRLASQMRNGGSA